MCVRVAVMLLYLFEKRLEKKEQHQGAKRVKKSCLCQFWEPQKGNVSREDVTSYILIQTLSGMIDSATDTSTEMVSKSYQPPVGCMAEELPLGEWLQGLIWDQARCFAQEKWLGLNRWSGRLRSFQTRMKTLTPDWANPFDSQITFNVGQPYPLAIYDTTLVGHCSTSSDVVCRGTRWRQSSLVTL